VAGLMELTEHINVNRVHTRCQSPSAWRGSGDGVAETRGWLAAAGEPMGQRTTPPDPCLLAEEQSFSKLQPWQQPPFAADLHEGVSGGPWSRTASPGPTC
jgi:hypothetical protein